MGGDGVSAGRRLLLLLRMSLVVGIKLDNAAAAWVLGACEEVSSRGEVKAMW